MTAFDKYMNCRLCLNKCKDAISIFKNKDQQNLWEIIYKYLFFKIEPNDIYSTKICKNCARNLIDFYNFHQFVEKCQLTLQTMHADSSKNQTNTTEHILILKKETDQDVLENEGSKLFEEAENGQMAFAEYSDRDQFADQTISEVSHFKIEFLTTEEESLNTETMSEGVPNDLQEEISATTYGSLFCKDCGIGFESKEKLNNHFNETKCKKSVAEGSSSITDIKNRTCRICLKVYKSFRHMKVHMQHMHSSKETIQDRTCPKCYKVYKNTRSVKQHLNTIHNREIGDIQSRTCRICSKVLFDINRLKKHMRRIHGQKACPKQRTCDVCSEVFPNVATLKEHMYGQHEKEQQDIKSRTCNKCSKVLSTRFSLTRHMESCCEILDKCKRNTRKQSSKCSNKRAATIEIHDNTIQKKDNQEYQTGKADVQIKEEKPLDIVND